MPRKSDAFDNTIRALVIIIKILGIVSLFIINQKIQSYDKHADNVLIQDHNAIAVNVS